MRMLPCLFLAVLGLTICNGDITKQAQAQTYGQVIWGQQQGTTTPNIVIYDGTTNVTVGVLNTVTHTFSFPPGAAATSLGIQAPNLFAMSPNGSSGTIVFRSPVSVDFPGGLSFAMPTLSIPTLTGNVTLTSPAPGGIQTNQWIVDTDQVRNYCYVANGLSHPLSTVSNCNGVATSGFTLGQWQALLPAATSLSNEVDWAAIQSIINAATGPISIRLPTGKAFMNNAITASTSSVEIFGSGSENNPAQTAGGTYLHFTGNTDGFDVGPGLTFSLRVHDIFMDSTTQTGSIYAFNLQSASMDYFENVAVNGFNNCFKELNPQGDFKSNVRCMNQQAAGTAGIGIGQEYDCTTGCFINHGYSELMNGYSLGYYYHSNNGTSPALEDQALTDSACGAVLDCIKIDSANTNYGPFNYKFTNMSVNAVGHFIFAPDCNNIVVTGGNWLPIAAVGTWANGTNKIDLGTATAGCHNVRLRDMWFGNQTVVTDNSLITAEAASNDIQIIGNHFETNNWTQSASWIQIANGATQVRERDSAWVSSFAPIAPPSNAITNASASPTNKLETYILGPPTTGTCGTGGATFSANSNGEQGTVTEGTAAPASCTINFPTPNRALTPSCVTVNTQTAFVNQQSSTTTALLTVTHAAGSTVWNYKCTPY